MKKATQNKKQSKAKKQTQKKKNAPELDNAKDKEQQIENAQEQAQGENQSWYQWETIFPNEDHAKKYIHDITTELAQIAQKHNMETVHFLLKMIKAETKNKK